MSSMPAGGEDKGSASSARADTPENAFAAEPTLADERDYSTDDDDDDDDEDASDSDDDDMPLGPLGRLVDSECDRFRQQYIGSQGSTTERGARLLWQTWEDATMLLRMREEAMWRRSFYATEDDLPSLETIRDYMNQPGFEEMWSQHVSQFSAIEPWGELISGATENEEATSSSIMLFRQSLEEWIDTARRQKDDLAETDVSDSLPPAPRPPGPPRPFRPQSSSPWPSILLAEVENKPLKGARKRRSLRDARHNPKSGRSKSNLKKVRSVDDPSSAEGEHAEQGQPGSSAAGGFI